MRATIVLLAVAALAAGLVWNAGEAASRAPGDSDRRRLLAAGRTAYVMSCAPCHRDDGRGVPGVFPPLADSELLASAEPSSVIRNVLGGMQGPRTVKGVTYDGIMPPMRHLPDAELAALLSYVYASWGNPAELVLPDEVAAARRQPNVAPPATRSPAAGAATR